jgi:hypothetical protein
LIVQPHFKNLSNYFTTPQNSLEYFRRASGATLRSIGRPHAAPKIEIFPGTVRQFTSSSRLEAGTPHAGVGGTKGVLIWSDCGVAAPAIMIGKTKS